MIYVYKYNIPRDSTTYIVSQSDQQYEAKAEEAALYQRQNERKAKESYSGCKYIITIVIIIIPSINIQSCWTYGDMILKTKYEIYFNLLTT